MRHALMLLALSSFMPYTWAETAPAQTLPPTTQTVTAPQVVAAPNTVAPVATPTQPSLRQNMPGTAVTPLTQTALQQKHKQEIEQQNKRMALLEDANQKALAQNQELQIKNDNLGVQIQVLQSERSAQMFLYGAVTFGAGIFVGIILYSVLYTRRRRF